MFFMQLCSLRSRFYHNLLEAHFCFPKKTFIVVECLKEKNMLGMTSIGPGTRPSSYLTVLEALM